MGHKFHSKGVVNIRLKSMNVKDGTNNVVIVFEGTDYFVEEGQLILNITAADAIKVMEEITIIYEKGE